MNNNTSPLPHVFISQAHLVSYGGSEMVTLELAEHFAAEGSQVTIGTWSIGKPVLSHLTDRANIAYFDIDDDRLSNLLQSNPPQLAWIHHQIVPQWLLRNPGKTAFVFNHMSSVHPLESSWSAVVEGRLAGLHLYNSAETLEAHLADGAAAFDPGRLKVFANPAPDDFGAVARPGRGRTQLIGVVSNHVPDELGVVMENPPAGVEFLPIGSGGVVNSVAARVTPETLVALDGVVTIGKTVQYAMLAGVPVYCYDKFGGPGWLDAKNFDLAEFHNFSGRGFSVKSPEEIGNELSGGIEAASDFAVELKSRDLSRFTLSSALQDVLSTLDQRPAQTSRLEAVEAMAHSRQQKLVGHYVRNWLRATQKLAQSTN
ncbi:hypothetical protein AB4089_01805 [Arthrobacter sp. 2MCAF15]|uniref:hypothetical protein n=1 Tax=Arthrobacter sp. 2MCAF15 TaxID=3232984 RepID=UPI003F8E75E3